MRPFTTIIVTAILSTTITAGCSSEDDGPGGGNSGRAVSMCSRLDECNYLDGLSEQECVDVVTDCVEALPDGYEHDWGVITDECLELQSCSLFGDCVVIPCE